MNAPPLPDKAAFDAETDQVLAAMRDRDRTASPFAEALGADLADQIRCQFGPGYGRIVMAVAQALASVAKVMQLEYDVTLGPAQLLAMAAIAAEKLSAEDGS